jgi:Mg/Co/Ni transporter MgtE
MDQEQEDNRAMAFNQSDSSKANPNDLRLKGGTLNPELVARDLISLNSSQFAEYPLEELSSDDILATFNLISDETLDKALTNIKPENLKTIFDKILPLDYESIFERLSPETQKYVLENTGLQEIS